VIAFPNVNKVLLRNAKSWVKDGADMLVAQGGKTTGDGQTHKT